MELNDPRQLVQLIDAVMYSMDKAGRKRFYLWVKQKRREYDFNFPLGGTYGKDSGVSVSSDNAESSGSKQQDGAEPSTETPEVVIDSSGVKS